MLVHVVFTVCLLTFFLVLCASITLGKPVDLQWISIRVIAMCKSLSELHTSKSFSVTYVLYLHLLYVCLIYIPYQLLKNSAVGHGTCDLCYPFPVQCFNSFHSVLGYLQNSLHGFPANSCPSDVKCEFCILWHEIFDCANTISMDVCVLCSHLRFSYLYLTRIWHHHGV